MKCHCVIHENRILYLLVLPLFHSMSYQLYYFLPIPNKRFEAIITSTKYLLHSDSGFISLRDICDKINHQYFCSQQLRFYANNTCETNIIKFKKSTACQYFKIEEEQSLELIPEINQYIGIFPNPVEFKTQCQEISTEKQLKGTYLFNRQPSCQISVSGNALVFNDTTQGQALLFETILEQHEEEIVPIPHIRLRPLQLSKLNHQVQHLELKEIETDNFQFSGTILAYIVPIGVGAFVVLKLIKKKRTPPQNSDINLDNLKI